MLRKLGYTVPVVAVLIGGLVWAADQKDRKKLAASAALLPHDLSRLMEEYDKNHDGFLQRDELPKSLQANFDKVDTNKDGKISSEELHRGMAYLQARRRPSDMVFILIEMSDCDECCAEELQDTYATLRKMDRNHDGKIDAEELREARHLVASERVDRLFKALDADKDGKISKEEARGLIREHFKQLDRNGDGFIDKKELAQAASERAQAPAGEKSGRNRSEQRNER